MSTRVPQSLATLFLFLWMGLPLAEQAVTVKGVGYPETVEVGGKRLKLLGAGLREKWFFDVYTMAAYSESGFCRPEVIISGEEIKSLRLVLLRDVSAEQLSGALADALARNTAPGASAELRGKIRVFLSSFRQDLAKGERMEMTYLPEVGVVITQNGEQQGAVTPGKDFADILWSCYFGPRTCCRGLKKQILSVCLGRQK